jgi:hypothetical protein
MFLHVEKTLDEERDWKVEDAPQGIALTGNFNLSTKGRNWKNKVGAKLHKVAVSSTYLFVQQVANQHGDGDIKVSLCYLVVCLCIWLCVYV